MRNLIIKFDDTFSNWKLAFQEYLDSAGIICNDDTITNICSSLNVTLMKYLSNNGYKPNATYTYRKGLTKRLQPHGSHIVIKTNYILLKYLEYFTDLTDYSKCFDISIEIDDLEKATKDMTFIAVGTQNAKGITQQPIYSKEYAEITKKLDILKVMVSNMVDPKIVKDTMAYVVDILEYLVERFD